jgi:hypothetical protein
MNCPAAWRLSTAKRTAFQSTGAVCHSSSKRGVSPSSKSDGFVFAFNIFSSKVSGSCIYRTLFAICSAVLVFPHHFGPSIETAPIASSADANFASASLGKYLLFNEITFIDYMRTFGIIKYLLLKLSYIYF